MSGDDDGFDASDDFGDGSWGKLASAVGDSWSLTSSVFVEDMAPTARSGGDANGRRRQRQRRRWGGWLAGGGVVVMVEW